MTYFKNNAFVKIANRKLCNHIRTFLSALGYYIDKPYADNDYLTSYANILVAYKDVDMFSDYRRKQKGYSVLIRKDAMNRPFFYSFVNCGEDISEFLKLAIEKNKINGR